jgi:hypothetical protein
MFNVDENIKTKRESSSNVSIGIGGILIIVIFVILCLTIFATLSFTTAYSDLKLSKKTEQMTNDYYLAHKRAEEKLSEIYDKLISVQSDLTLKYDKDVSKLDNFNIIATSKLTDLNGIEVVKQDESNNSSDLVIYYEALGDFNQKICVTLNIYYDDIKNEPYYEIVSWNLSNIELPNYEEEIYDLWEGIDE